MSSLAAAVPENPVYVAVGKESSSTLFWAIQNFRERNLHILHVHHPFNFAPFFGNVLEEVDVGAYRRKEMKKMQKKLDTYLSICSEYGVRADKVHIEMVSVEEGILHLIEKFKIKELVMGAASDGSIIMDRNLNEPKSRKARYVGLHAPPFCTIYFIFNGPLILKRLTRDEASSAENELPTTSMSSSTAEIEALCKAKAHEKLYTKELRKREAVEEELKETQDQKMILERLVNEMRQKMSSDSELLTRRQLEQHNLLKRRDDATNLIKEHRRQSAEDQPRTEPFYFFALSHLETAGATNQFDLSMILGENDRGTFYKGSLHGTPVTVRILTDYVYGRPSAEFDREVEVLSNFRHPNLATLIGATEEISAIVYEYFPNGTLEDRLMCKNETPPLSWQTRTRIVLELCSAFIFLHNRGPQCVVHSALTPSCILDSNFTSKLIGFDFYGEASPESDVYSFGIIVLQLLTGKPAESVIQEV